MIRQHSLGRQMRSAMLRQAGLGFRTHPLLMLGLLVVASVAIAGAFAALFVTAALAAAILALGLIAYGILAQVISPGASRRVRRMAAREPSEALLRFLAAVDEFARLYDLAMTAGVDRPPRGRQYRTAIREAQDLHDFASDLSLGWRGAKSVAVSMRELESATAALCSYLVELCRRPKDRPAPTLLRFYRDDLTRRRDALAASVRDAEFRPAAT